MIRFRKIIALYFLVASSGAPLPIAHDHDMLQGDHHRDALHEHASHFHRSSELPAGDEFHWHWVFAFGACHQSEQGIHAEEAIASSRLDSSTLMSQWMTELRGNLVDWGIGTIALDPCSCVQIARVGFCGDSPHSWVISSDSQPTVLRC